MTSEFEHGPELFETPVERESEGSGNPKPTKRIVKRRASEGPAQVVVKIKQAEPAVETPAEPIVDQPTADRSQKQTARRRGRPPRKAVQAVEEPAKEVSAVPESIASTPEPTPITVVTQPTQEKSQQPVHMNANQHRPSQQNRVHQQNGKQNGRQKQNHQKGNFQPRQNVRASSQIEDIPVELYVEDPSLPRMVVNDLTVMTLPALRQKASEFSISEDAILDYKRQELIVEILKAHASRGGVIMAYGALEVLPDGYGFLRSPQNNYLSGPEDIYVSISQIKMLSLKTGDTVEGQIRPPRDAERYFAMIKVQSINHDPPEVARARASFDSLTPLYPDSRLNLETEESDISTRIINLFCPIGKGQRSLIVAPPRAGKTILMQKIANAISENHPEVYLMVLLIDERPEEVTDMRRTVKGEVIASTFDEQATRHVSVAEMVIEKAKRLVEHKRDVVILLDNITRLARAYNQTVPASGKILSGGVDSNALHKPKRFLGAARNIEHGGSLTIIASALIETGSRMDEVIFEEFKGTGNNEIVLDRRMAERRLYPAINIKKSGTRREDLLLTQEETAKIWALRNAINPMEDIEMTELLIDKMKKTKNNEAFLRSMNTGFM
ncbi:MAG: transcription termination factor Rho [Sphaerochaetaceae bacterium]|jgi:transcription termination factor Rho|nr:transcription termination factor Rho [Sphaerochaetaceae bacterium]MDX9939928.1 transcription termination factor Rho [Sphaerochaetaceae bacterium]